MKKQPTITEIKKHVIGNGGQFYKTTYYLNGNDAYCVNGRDYTKPRLIEAYQLGLLGE